MHVRRWRRSSSKPLSSIVAGIAVRFRAMHVVKTPYPSSRRSAPSVARRFGRHRQQPWVSTELPSSMSYNPSFSQLHRVVVLPMSRKESSDRHGFETTDQHSKLRSVGEAVAKVLSRSQSRKGAGTPLTVSSLSKPAVAPVRCPCRIRLLRGYPALRVVAGSSR